MKITGIAIVAVTVLAHHGQATCLVAPNGKVICVNSIGDGDGHGHGHGNKISPLKLREPVDGGIDTHSTSIGHDHGHDHGHARHGHSHRHRVAKKCPHTMTLNSLFKMDLGHTATVYGTTVTAEKVIDCTGCADVVTAYRIHPGGPGPERFITATANVDATTVTEYRCAPTNVVVPAVGA